MDSFNILICRTTKLISNYVEGEVDPHLDSIISELSEIYENLFIMTIPSKSISRLNPNISDGHLMITYSSNKISLREIDGAGPAYYQEGESFEELNSKTFIKIEEEKMNKIESSAMEINSKDVSLFIKDVQILVSLN